MADNKILIADDEPYYLEWLVEFLKSQNYDVEVQINVNDAYEILTKVKYRAVILDLNIPVEGSLKNTVAAKGRLYAEYPGLFLADYARNKGHRTRQVIVYSVHTVEAVADECRRLYCTYMAKGRPVIFKKEIMEVLSYDPTRD